MYSSLETLDFAIRRPGDETARLVLTDHRSALAITDDAALSIVFAVARCLAARAIGDADAKLQPYQVVYQLDDEPPAFFAYAISAAGALLQRTPAPGAPTPPRVPELVTLISDACAVIGRDVCRREHIELTVAGLSAYEQRLEVTSDDAYHRAIVELGAVVAAFARARYPAAAWKYLPGETIPFALAPPGVAPGMELRVFGLARRYLEGVRSGIRDMTFEETGGRTRVVMHDLYPSKKALDEAIASGATSGTAETFEQLDGILVGATG